MEFNIRIKVKDGKISLKETNLQWNEAVYDGETAEDIGFAVEDYINYNY